MDSVRVLLDYFHRRIAATITDLRPPPLAISYLAEVMVRAPELSPEPLATRLLGALPEPRRRSRLRELGEEALMAAGPWSGAARRLTVPQGYFCEVGSVAYGALAGSVWADPYSEVFADLERRFAAYARAVAGACRLG